MSERYQSFEEFWPFYLGEHSLAATRWLHFVGTTIGMGVLASAIASGTYWAIPLSIVPGYAFAWISHYTIEKNRPATFQYPLWSFIGDFKMWALMATGRINAEVKRCASV